MPEKLPLYGIYVYYVVHICDFGMLRVNKFKHSTNICQKGNTDVPGTHQTSHGNKYT